MDDVTTEEYEHIPENWDVHSCMSEENAKASNLEDHTELAIEVFKEPLLYIYAAEILGGCP